MEPFARIPLQSEDYEDSAQRDAVDEAAGPRRHSTRKANLGTFTGYRIGLDVGNGNIGWCILFEDGTRLHFLTAEDVAAHNRALPESGRRTQLPDLARFVPAGVHKFDARETDQRGGQKSYSKIRAEARAGRRMLDARQQRRLHVDRALRNAGLLPKEGEGEGHVGIEPDVLRVKLLDPSFPAHPHDLGRALKNALKRRGYLKPVGRTGPDEGSGFAKGAEAAYRQTLEKYDCRTIGEFLERCARDAGRDGVPFRKRHRSLAWQKQNRKRRPNEGDDAPSYEAFQFLSPTHTLIREECRLLKERSGIAVADDAWAEIEAAAEFRRPLKGRIPGRCRHFPDEHRCVAALPSFQRFRILERIRNLRHWNGARLDGTTFGRARELLEAREKITLAGLERELGVKLKLDRDDATGSRRFIGARTDIALGDARVFGEAWSRLPIDRRDDWTMRFLRRHRPSSEGEVSPWSECDEEALERDAEAAFGEGALARVDDGEIAKHFEDRFSSISLKAARLLGDCHEQGLGHEERLARLRAAGAPAPELALYERLPYYGVVMPDETVPAAGFAPEDRTAKEEWEHGRAANPDVHVVMNRLRVVINGIIEMMGGILPTRCVIEMARSTFSEAQAAAYGKTARARQELRERIEGEIEKALGSRMPVGPALDRLVDRWKAAIRQGWRDYDGSEIQRSALVDGSEYQLDHVEPAAFGDFREDNIFVSRFNQRKGRRLPWEAFGDDPEFQPALTAFSTFGLRKRIEVTRKNLQALPDRAPRDKRERLERALERAERDLGRLSGFDAPRPDVLQALERPPVVSETDREEKAGTTRRAKPSPFRPGSQAALFRRLHPDYTPREGGPAARDVANIGWSTKLARRYLRHIGAETEPIKAWAVRALRCMFGVDKPREDLRNHAVDAFLVAHFDRFVLKPAFDRLRHEHPYEELYETRALQDALSRIGGGSGSSLYGDLVDNLDRLGNVLPTIATAHRADHQWNPGDALGGGLGALGKENVYSFRPTWAEREKLTLLLRKAGVVPDDEAVLTGKEILAWFDTISRDTGKGQRLAKELAGKIELRYRKRSDDQSKATVLKRKTALPLSNQEGAFINAEGKFAVVGAPAARDRLVLSIADFLGMSSEERANVFAAGQPIYRRGDTVVKDGGAFVVTGLQHDKRLIVYPINEAERKPSRKEWITVSPGIIKFASDVLGRRLHQLGKDPRGLQPVPYPLRSE